jgi:hypothetical protein
MALRPTYAVRIRSGGQNLACLGIFLLLTGCSPSHYLIEGLPEASDGTTDAASEQTVPTDDASSHDASDDVAVDASFEAEVDAAEETTPTADAEAGGPTVPFCADAGAFFCADFDESPLPSGFQSYDGSFLSISTSNSVSSPASLLVTIPSNLGTGSYGSKLIQSFGATGTTFTTTFAYLPRLVSTTTSNGVLVWAMDFTNNANVKYSVRLAYGGSPGAVRIEESYLSSKPDVYHRNFNLPLNEWSTVAIQMSNLDGDGGTGTLDVRVDGVPIGPADTLSPPPGVILAPTVLLGAVYGNYPEHGWTLQYDNFLFDMR